MRDHEDVQKMAERDLALLAQGKTLTPVDPVLVDQLKRVVEEKKNVLVAAEIIQGLRAGRERLQSELAAARETLDNAAATFAHAFPDRQFDAGPPEQRIAMLLIRQERKLAAAQITIDQQAALLKRGRERLAAANERAEKVFRELKAVHSEGGIWIDIERVRYYLSGGDCEAGAWEVLRSTPARIPDDKALTRQNSDTSAPITSDVDANVNTGECRQEPKPLPLGHEFVALRATSMDWCRQYVNGSPCGRSRSAHQPGKDQA